jgi:hypothetical protein
MQWSDVTRAPTAKMLRQFAGLSLVIFGGLAAWRYFGGSRDAWTWGFAIAAALIGGIGLVAPMAIRWVFTGWLIVAFPIGWLVSRVVLAIVFFVVFTPVALVFKLIGRDVLRRRRRSGETYWVPKPMAGDVRSYFRQF